MPTLLSVQDAAAVLGISISGVRRGLKSGRLQGQRQSTPQGHVWLVEVPDDQVVNSRSPGRRVAGDRRPDSRVVNDQPDPPQDGAASPQMANLTQRAEDMAVYSHRLLEPYVAQIAAQAERIGHLEAELEQARAQAAPQTQNAAPMWPERRRWWQRLVWG